MLRRGKAYMHLEMYDVAIKDFESANKMDRGSYEAIYLLQQATNQLNGHQGKYYYRILDISKYANGAQIKKARDKGVLEHHPGKKISHQNYTLSIYPAKC